MKIYTRTGDSGETSLFGGRRVSKADARVAAYGDVDELNAWLGLVRSGMHDTQLAAMLEQLQRDLFAVGARLADPAHRIAERVAKTAIGTADVERLEKWIDELEAELPALRRFILPGGGASGAGLAGGGAAGASLHVARTVSRRAERSIIALGADALEPEILVYMNRISDLLFVMARAANHRGGFAETEW